MSHEKPETVRIGDLIRRDRGRSLRLAVPWGHEGFPHRRNQTSPVFPPDWVFPVVWAVLYALMGIGAARVWLSPPSPARSKGLNLYVLQLIVNFFWSPIFFNGQAYFLAFLWLMLLWALVFGMTLFFYQADLPAAKLQIPYRVWLIYAAYLNLGVWYLNS